MPLLTAAFSPGRLLSSSPDLLARGRRPSQSLSLSEETGALPSRLHASSLTFGPSADIPQTPGMPDPSSDMVSRLLKERIIMLGDQVDDSLANALIAQMLYLANENPSEPITMLINSPGGSVSAGLAIYDTMNYLPCEVHTTCVGMAASMGSFLLSSGTKGKRKSFPNAQIMIHQPLGGAGGQAADVEIQVKEIMHTRQKLDTYLAYNTGQPYEKIRDDCDRDFWMTAEEAKEYGLIDEVIQTKTSHIKIPEIPTLAY